MIEKFFHSLKRNEIFQFIDKDPFIGLLAPSFPERFRGAGPIKGFPLLFPAGFNRSYRNQETTCFRSAIVTHCGRTSADEFGRTRGDNFKDVPR